MRRRSPHDMRDLWRCLRFMERHGRLKYDAIWVLMKLDGVFGEFFQAR